MPSLGFSPFKTVGGDDAVKAGSWHLNGDAVGEGSAIPNWGYGMPLIFTRVVALDIAAIRKACGLDRNSRICVTPAWSAKSAINFGSVGEIVEVSLDRDSVIEHELTLEVPSPSLANTLRLSTTITLQYCGTNSSAAAARQPGSTLWIETSHLVLEGRSARMPILAADFRSLAGTEKNAAWYLWTTSEWLSRHLSAGVTVYVNASNSPILTALTTRQPDPTQSAIQAFFYHDVGRALIERALADEDFSDDADYDRDSVGRSLRATLRTLFNHQTLDQIRDAKKTDPAAFDRLLQARHKLAGWIR